MGMGIPSAPPREAEVRRLRARITKLERERRRLTETQRSLAAANQRLQQVMATMAEGYYLLDSRWRFVELNPFAARHFGRPAAELIGNNLWDVLGTSPNSAFRHAFRVALEGGRPFWFEAQSEMRPGFWKEMSLYPREGGLAVYFRDITARKRAEEALRESERRLASDLEAMTRLQKIGTLFVRELDIESVLAEIVDAAIAISGADFGNIQLLDRRTSQLKIVAQRGFPDWWVDYWNAVCKGHGVCGTALERGQRVIVEDVETSPIFAGTPALDIQLRAGVRAVQSTPLIARTGDCLGMLSTHYRAPRRPDERVLRVLDLLARQAADIIERAHAEEALCESEERYRTIVETANEGIWRVNADLVTTFVNRKMAEMMGYEPHEMLGLSLYDFGGHEGRDDLDRRIADRRRGLRASYERKFTRKDGSPLWVIASTAPLFDGQGRYAGSFGMFTDITQRKRDEEHLRQAQKMESIGLLAGGAAHDFNNLLVGVTGNASLILEMLPPDHPAVGLAREVIQAGEQAAHLTRQMLAYAGKGKLSIEPLHLSTAVPAMVGLVRPAISKKIALHLDLDPATPAIEADRGQIQQVVMNLVLNAGEAIGDREGSVTVRAGACLVDGAYLRLNSDVSDLPPGPYVFFEVRDSGCGMDDDTKARIFDPFFSTKFTGRGLGLAAVAGIVRGHRGAIIVRSAPGEGSTFTALFPPAAASTEALSTAAAVSSLPGAGVVLVVDDEPAVRKMACKALERRGYRVLTADSGRAAIDLFAAHADEISLVVLDLSMSNMSGEETLPELRRVRPGIQVLISSGYSEAETMALFRDQPVSGFLHKPYTASGLSQKVRLALA